MSENTGAGHGAGGAGDAEARSHCGHLFVFRGKRGGLIKVLWHDGQGLCLLSKRLERGRFLWPRIEGEAVTISAAQLGYLLEGSTGVCRTGHGDRRLQADTT